MKTLNWGLVGAGDIARKRVAPALRDLPGCCPFMVTRSDRTKLDEFAEDFGFKHTAPDLQSLIKETEVEAVYLATPVSLHASQAIAALEEGKHVLCEKPMALTAEDARRMIDASIANDRKLGIAYYRSFYPVVDRIKQIISSGIIGNVVSVHVLNFEPFDRQPGEPRYWLLEPSKSGGGPMMDMGCHRIDLLINILGPVRTVTAVNDTLRFNRKVEDHSTAVLRFEQPVMATLISAHCAAEPKDSFEFYGTKGSIIISNLNSGKLELITENGSSREEHTPGSNTHIPLIDDFTKSVFENREPRVNGQQALLTTKILDDIYNR